MFALVDCNNFYASCECLFEPKYIGRPLVVLSNNDGCVIARSQEAKALGIVMGTPAHLAQDSFRKNNVVVCSSNYTLYGDMSDRVMKTMKSFVPRMEIYSIDEAFLDLSELSFEDLDKLGLAIRETVNKNTGIPVSVGIASTKTLAKMANRYAKKKHRSSGVFYASDENLVDEMLGATAVEDIWGIGHQYALLLRKNGLATAKDLTRIPGDWVRRNMSVTGLRLWNELLGVPSKEWEFEPKDKKNICTSRSFGKLTNDYSIIKEAISNHAATCALKLRNQQTVCRFVKIFISTNPHKVNMKQCHHAIVIQCETATNSTPEIIAYSIKGLDLVFDKNNFLYMKCGVEVLDVIPETELQLNMFDLKDRNKSKKALEVMDMVNKEWGRGTIRMAVQRFDNRYRLRADFLSKRFTTRLDEIIQIHI